MTISAPKMEDALTSMLRTDYIPLRDTEKLQRLRDYYVDYMGYVPQILGETDQLIVGRRGTGKTTLLYRALIECMRSWKKGTETEAKPQTLGIYLDLNKCQALAEVKAENFIDFEHVFITELCEVIKEELNRSWPDLNRDPGFFGRLFTSAEAKKASEVRQLIEQLAKVLVSGIPRLAERTTPSRVRTLSKTATTSSAGAKGSVNAIGAQAALEASASISDGSEHQTDYEETVRYRLTVADIIRLLGQIREAAEISCIIIFIDEFSALSVDLQRRFTTLLKRFIGNHQGIFVKVCAITDNYTLGTSIILQRDLFELPLDLDAYVERSSSLGSAMNSLEDATREIVQQRLKSYLSITPGDLFEDSGSAWKELSRAAMGVPRTLGIVLKYAWARSANSNRKKISRTDIEHGIRAASKAYYKQLEGATRDGLAIPRFVSEMWDGLIGRAISEKSKSGGDASHFMVLVRNQERLKYLNMFFLVHLLTDGRTTKKESSPRGLYSFDYGICLENNLGFASDKNVIRQQRFAYDDVMRIFDKYFLDDEEKKYTCPQCGSIYLDRDLIVAGKRLNFCPEDRAQLKELGAGLSKSGYTEEEIKIIGSIRSATEEDSLGARIIADDVGCYVQKVAKFAEKLEKAKIVARKRSPAGPYIYFDGGE